MHKRGALMDLHQLFYYIRIRNISLGISFSHENILVVLHLQKSINSTSSIQDCTLSENIWTNICLVQLHLTRAQTPKENIPMTNKLKQIRHEMYVAMGGSHATIVSLLVLGGRCRWVFAAAVATTIAALRLFTIVVLHLLLRGVITKVTGHN